MSLQETVDAVIAKAESVISRNLDDLEKSLVEFAVIQTSLMKGNE